MSPNSGRTRFLKELLLHPVFWAVLLLKLLASAFFASHFLSRWFGPFVATFVASGFQNPWEHFLALGEPQAFPYPPAMLYVLALFRLAFLPLVPADPTSMGPAQLLVTRLPLLLSDLAIYAVLAAWFRDRVSRVRLWYWCSPVVFYISYFHGQLDHIPTALFMLCLYFLGRRQLWPATLLCGLAFSTKHHLWIALPFLVVYLRSQLGWPQLLGFCLLPVAVYLGLSWPYLDSAAYREMVLNNEQQAWVFLLSVPLGKWNTAFLLCPAALLFLFAKYAVYPRQNWDLTLLFLGLAFTIFVVLVPPMPGWYLWSVPFLIYYLCRFQRGGALLIFVFSAAYLAYFLLGQRSDLFECLPAQLARLQPAWMEGRLGPSLSPVVNNLYFTIMQASLLALAMVMYTTGVRSNEVYTSRRKPLMIGIAGDSGVGKDRLASHLAALLGERDVIRLAGDDYHRWERGDQRWQTFTHLNPKGNRLHEQLEHTVALIEGRSVSKVSYDHHTGRFSQPELLDPRKNIVVQGLHSFLLERQRQLFDVKIFLDPDERLRFFWKLRRDHLERGYTRSKVLEALRRRRRDRATAVLPQAAHADLVLRVHPLSPGALRNLRAEPELGLEVEGRNHYDFESVAAALGKMPGVKVELSYPRGLSRIRLKVRGQPSEEELNRAWPELLPDLPDRLGVRPRFPGGLDGVMLLCAMVALESNLKFNRSAA